jgi:hypothetical protein
VHRANAVEVVRSLLPDLHARSVPL